MKNKSNIALFQITIALLSCKIEEPQNEVS